MGVELALSLIGSLRSSAQMISYEVAMGMAVVSAILMTSLNKAGTGTLSMIGIVQAQQEQQIWFLFKFFPLGFIAFVIFAIAMVAETNRAPFDLPEAESELTAGFHTEYSGLRWSLFMLGEYAAMIAVSSIAVTLWLGGWMRPFPHLLTGDTWDLVFSLFPGLLFLGLAAIAFVGVARMPKHPYFRFKPSASPDSAQCSRSSVWCCSYRRCATAFRIYSGSRQSRRLYVPVYLVSRHVPALPIRSINEGGMESSAANRDRRGNFDRGHGRGLLICNRLPQHFSFTFCRD